MSKAEKFTEEIIKGYTFKGDSITLGAAMYETNTIGDAKVKIPLKTLNRHGLIAGATGTGKTKTLQLIAEGLSAKGVPVLVMDIKGDLSGIAAAGAGHPKIDERMEKIGLPWQPTEFPTEFLTLSDELGARLRATVSEFGPVLFSKILDLNDAQSGMVALLFKYCDDNKLPLLDLKDFKKILQFAGNEGKDEIEQTYGRLAVSSVGTILRKIIELEQQGAEKFFGEISFDVDDLIRIDDNGKGMISVIRLTDIQDKPKLFSTFMLSLLAEVYASFPEEGDLDQPKLVIFIDEAHLIFNEASKALLNQIETIIKLIRSKAIGVIFCTQNPTDIPDAVLSQLGLKVQHALRAFTAKDRKMIKLTAENYPLSDHYKVDEMLTSLGIGEAAITVLNEKGIPTPLAATLLCAPQSRMDILSNGEIKDVVDKSKISKRYNEIVDRESAYEILTSKIESAAAKAEPEAKATASKSKGKEEKSKVEEILSSTTTRQIGRTVARELTRGLLGVLGISSTKRRKKSSSWF